MGNQINTEENYSWRKKAEQNLLSIYVTRMSIVGAFLLAAWRLKTLDTFIFLHLAPSHAPLRRNAA